MLILTASDEIGRVSIRIRTVSAGDRLVREGICAVDAHNRQVSGHIRAASIRDKTVGKVRWGGAGRDAWNRETRSNPTDYRPDVFS